MKAEAARPKQTAAQAAKKRLDGDYFKRKLEDTISTRFRVRRAASQGIDTALWLAARY
jgi:hypothetical protein